MASSTIQILIYLSAIPDEAAALKPRLLELSNATWQLQQTTEDRWLLVVKGQPQINLLAAEASTLLYRYKSRFI